MLALAGLRGAGKSFISRILVEEFGWTRIYKHDMLRKLHERSDDLGNWEHWYLQQYRERGVSAVTEDILQVLPQTTPLVLDAVHNPIEWHTIKSRVLESRLFLVVASREVRERRRGPNQDEANRTRLSYWHEQKGSSSCLAAEVDWTLNGAASIELLRLELKQGLMTL